MLRRILMSAAILLMAAACDRTGPVTGPLDQTPALSRFGRPDIVVHPGQSIQAAIDAVEPGARIFVRPGVYREALTIDKPGIKLVGLGRLLGSRGQGVPVIENPGDEEDGIHVGADGDGVQLVNLVVRDFEENGVLLDGVDGFLLSEIVAEDDGEYGLFPVRSKDGVIERCRASGHSDTGIYVGQSEDVVIRNSLAFGNVNGFEIENSSRVRAVWNRAYDNTAGFLAVLLPGLDVKVSSDVELAHNRSDGNNRPNFAEDGFEALVPAGSGILIVGVDAANVHDNDVTGNEFVGVGLASSLILAALSGGAIDPGDILADIEPFPVGARVVDNAVTGNGGAASPPLGLPTVDLLWDGSGSDNCWAGNTFDTSFDLALFGGTPGPGLPACS